MPRRRGLARLPRVPRSAVPGRIRLLGKGIRQSLRRPHRGRRRAQLEQRSAQRGARSRRHRRGGPLSQHRAAVLPPGEPGRPPTGYRRRARAALGGPACAQSLAGRLLLVVARTARRGGPDPARGPRRGRRRDHADRQVGPARRCPAARDPSGRGIPQLYAEHWEPLWAACDEAGVVVNHHGGNAGPNPTDGWGSSFAVWVYETHWFAHRALWHLIFSGALDRHPDLTVVFTEQGAGWIPATLDSLDVAAARYGRANSAIARFAGPTAGSLSLKPSGFWARQCYVGASFMRPVECAERHRIGVEKIMWGSDYPHLEGTAPYTREALRHTFSCVPADEVAAMVGGNAAAVYGFDLDALAPLVDRIGPTVAEVAEPLAVVPADASSTVFEPDPIRTW
ncbi:amidohydrolase family protein [Mycobacterium interjectum]|uniref:amidohydrolase family protein n=1 Tax=Mycobacterium interjectum TaxID=33895 RepID=UPI0035567DB1